MTAKKEKKEETKKETPVEDAALPIDMSKLTPTQQRVSGYAKTAAKEPPKITDVKDLFVKIEMQVPDEIKRGPEYDYAWLDVNSLSSLSGSKWEIVNRNNHSHVHDRHFDLSGAILYKGQNILAFCYREVRELEQKEIVRQYNEKTEKMTKTEEQAADGEVRRIDPQAAGNVVNSGLVDDFVDPRQYPAETDDF